MNVSERVPEGIEPAAPVSPLRPPRPEPIQIVVAETEEATAGIATVESGESPAGEQGPVSVSEVSVRTDRLTTVAASSTSAALAVLTAGAAHKAAAAQADARAELLIAHIRSSLRPGLSPEIQNEAAALISLISDVGSQEFNEYFRELEIAASSLLCERPNLILAKRLRRSVSRRTSLMLRPLLFLRSGHPAIQVILGLTANLYLALPLAFLMLTLLVDMVYGPGTREMSFILVAVSGAIGSIVSILVRIQDFDDQKAEHRSILFFTGFFKPIIGITSALFALVVLRGGLLPVQLPSRESELYFFIALAFVAGFSERLAGDLVSKTEGKLPTPHLAGKA